MSETATAMWNVRTPPASHEHTINYMVFVGPALLVEYNVKLLVHEYELRNPRTMMRSRAYFCPHCGEIWARFQASGYPFNYVIRRACANHWSLSEPEAGQLVEYATSADPIYPREVYEHDLRFIFAKELELESAAEVDNLG